MPLIIPKTLPAYDALYEENVFVMHRERAASQHIRPLEILILNLMPTKIATETQIARLLANTPLQVHMTLLQTVSHEATHVSAAHLDAFYKTFDEVKNDRYDGMIIRWTTGTSCARSWTSARRTSTPPSMSAGVHRRGCITTTASARRSCPRRCSASSSTGSPGPRTRWCAALTRCSRADVDGCKALRILAESDEAGPFLMSTENGRQIFVTGHPEYDKYTLDAEYKRDVAKGLPIAIPKNYYPNDDPEQPPLFRWRAHAHLLYENWLNYYVYQNTPYDLGAIERVKHETR